MGILIGTFAAILGLVFVFFPKLAMNILRLKGKGLHKKDKKTKFEIAKPPAYELFEEKKAILWTRIIGIIFLIASIFAYLSPSAP